MSEDSQISIHTLTPSDLPEVCKRLWDFANRIGHRGRNYFVDNKFILSWTDWLRAGIGFGWVARDQEGHMVGILTAMLGPEPLGNGLVAQEIFMDADPETNCMLKMFSLFEQYARDRGCIYVASGYPPGEVGERQARFLAAKRYSPMETWCIKEL
jgi:hypothetical protein